MAFTMKTNDAFNNYNDDSIRETETNIKDLQEFKSYNEAETKIDFDDILAQSGEFGLYQGYLFIMTIPFYFYLAFVYNSQQFITEASDNYWCRVPELENFTTEERISISLPLDSSSKYGYSRCQSYNANWSKILGTGERPLVTDLVIVECQNGWEFDDSEISYPTITSELGWVCDKDSYQATAQAIFFCGAIVGGFLIGNIADRFGRLPALVLSNVLSCIGGISTSFATNFTQFAICRFIVGLGYDNVCTMIYILVLEYTAPKYRSIMANISYALFYCMAASLLPWIALVCGHWKLFSLVTSIPMSLAVLLYFVLPESPRWLLSMGKINATVDILKRIAQVNKHPISDSIINDFKKSATLRTSVNKISLLELIHRPLLLKILFLQAVLFIISDVVFDALVRMSGKIGYNLAISFTLSSLTEFPSLVLLMLILDRYGRQKLFFGSMIICGLFNCLAAFVPSGVPSVCCCVLARFFVNMGYSTAMQWAPESLPTEVRASGVAFIHISAYIAVIVSPFIVYLETVYPWLPLLVIGLAALVGAGFSLLLPETCGKPLPQTLEDSENLMRTHNVSSIFLRINENTSSKI